MRAARPALVVLLTVCPLLAQQPNVPPPQRPIPQPNTRLKSTQYNIVVQGCVQNGRLKIPDRTTVQLPFDTLNVSEFILEGPKEMLRQIQDRHNRHYDEIAGIATVPPPPNETDAAVEADRKGPVRITVGRRDEKAVGAKNAPQQIRLRVASLTHISEDCVERP